MSDSEKPLIALTMGDASGIGPEVLVKAVLDQQDQDCCVPLAVAHTEILKRTVRSLGANLSIIEVETPDQFRSVEADSGKLACWVPPLKPAHDEVLAVPPGQIPAATSRAA